MHGAPPDPGPRRGQIINVYRSTGQDPYGVFSYPEYTSYRDHNTVLAGVAAFAAPGYACR